MKIGIDISQMAYPRTGVANYVKNLVEALLAFDNKNEYILFFSSLRKKFNPSDLQIPPDAKVTIKNVNFPPSALDLLWNKLHILPIENIIGDVDVFIASDWTQPPMKKARSATILYDLIVYKYPDETDKKIVVTHKRRLKWVKKECAMIFCISESTKKDAMDLLGIEEKRLHVINAGV